MNRHRPTLAAAAALLLGAAALVPGRGAAAASDPRVRVRALIATAEAKAKKAKQAVGRAEAAAAVAERVRTGSSTTLAPPNVSPADGSVARQRLTVRSVTLPLVDTARGTSAWGKEPSKPERALPTTVWFPADADPASPLPMLVFAHGLGGSPERYETLLSALAGYGYVVAAPRFPLSSDRTVGGPSILDEPNQPADVRFVIGRVLAPGAVDPKVVIDPARIGMAGHSLGAITTLDTTVNSCCSDRRIRAAAVISGTVNPLTSGTYFRGPGLPMLFLHGDRDATVPYMSGVSAYALAARPKWFVTVVGGDHTFGLAGRSDGITVAGPLYAAALVHFFDRYVRGDTSATDHLGALVASHASLLRLDAEAA